MNKAVALGLLLTSSLVLAGCWPFPDRQPAEQVTPAANTQVSPVPASAVVEASPTPESAVVDESVDYEIEAKNFSYSLKTIEMKAGETIRVKLVNAEGTHDLMIAELEVKSKLLKAGESTVVEITAPVSAKGQSYEFYCSVGNHRQMGMSGTIMIK